MSIEKAYNSWASRYDDMLNKTRDLEDLITKKILGKTFYNKILEIGCGTGKTRNA